MLSATGCGGAHGNISGKVTYKGQPVRFGSVVVVGSDKTPVTGPIDQGGNYLIEDAPAGEVQIGVVSPDPTIAANKAKAMSLPKRPKADEKEDGKHKIGNMPAQEAPADSARAKKKWVQLPKDVQFPDRSGITTTVQPGENTFNIELK
jgi:hypothetical protein